MSTQVAIHSINHPTRGAPPPESPLASPSSTGPLASFSFWPLRAHAGIDSCRSFRALPPRGQAETAAA